MRSLLTPDALKITAEPVRRLSDRALLAYQLRWRLPRIDAVPSREDFWTTAAAFDLQEPLDDALLAAQLEVAKQVQPAGVLISLSGWRRSRPDLARLLSQRVTEAGLPTAGVVWRLRDDESFPAAAPTVDLATDLRLHGFRLAFNNLGDGRARLEVVARVLPDMILLDRSLLEGLPSEPGLRAVLLGLLEFGAQASCALVAGGISTQEELAHLAGLGVPYGLGPVFGLPTVAAGSGAVRVPRTRRVISLEQMHREIAVPKPRLAGPRPQPESLGRIRKGLTVTEVLGHAARSLQGEHDPHAILEIAADHLEQLVPCDAMAVYEADWGSLRFRPMLARSALEESFVSGVMAHTFPIGTGVTGWAFDLGTPQMVNDADAHPSAAHIPGTNTEDDSMLVIPLIAGDQRLGAINLVRFRRDAYIPEDLTMASLVGHMAAAAWRNAQLYAEQFQHAITDPLTGLLNTRWLRDAGRRELALADRTSRDLALLLADLDSFKSVNDSCGHEAGDGVLREAGHALHEAIRAGDAAVRYGGEEFVLLLHDAGPVGVRRVTKELRRRLAAIQLPPGCSLARVTCSVGIATFPEHGLTINQLLAAADGAMYTAKRRGGDRAASA